MAKVFDILTGDDDDIYFVNGDFATGESTYQHMRDIILSHKGNYKQSPFVGVGLSTYENDDDGQRSLEAETQNQLELDGMKVILNKSYYADAEYK